MPVLIPFLKIQVYFYLKKFLYVRIIRIYSSYKRFAFNETNDHHKQSFIKLLGDLSRFTKGYA